MKLVSSTFYAGLISLASAEWNQMEEDFAMLAQNYTAMHQGYRGFTGIIATALSPINHYGCWCYFQQFAGRGTPINEVDQICKVLQQGYECAYIDGVEEGEPCTAFETEYASGITIGSDDVTIECQDKNPNNNCAMRSCIIEGNFVLSIFAAFFSNVDFDPDQKHIEEGGVFDPATCVGAPAAPVIDNGDGDGNGNGGGSSGPGDCGCDNCAAKTCCGDYPVRYPFKKKCGDSSCCGDIVFATADSVCCPSNILLLGDTC